MNRWDKKMGFVGDAPAGASGLSFRGDLLESISGLPNRKSSQVEPDGTVSIMKRHGMYQKVIHSPKEETGLKNTFIKSFPDGNADDWMMIDYYLDGPTYTLGQLDSKSGSWDGVNLTPGDLSDSKTYGYDNFGQVWGWSVYGVDFKRYFYWIYSMTYGYPDYTIKKFNTLFLKINNVKIPHGVKIKSATLNYYEAISANPMPPPSGSQRRWPFDPTKSLMGFSVSSDYSLDFNSTPADWVSKYVQMPIIQTDGKDIVKGFNASQYDSYACYWYQDTFFPPFVSWWTYRESYPPCERLIDIKDIMQKVVKDAGWKNGKSLIFKVDVAIADSDLGSLRAAMFYLYLKGIKIKYE